MKYKHIFFDLDKTLWDFDTNSSQALTELFIKYNLSTFNVSCPAFIKSFKIQNDQHWDAYRKNLIDQQTLRLQRFHKTLLEFNINDNQLCSSIAEDYIIYAPSKTNLIPYTLEVLSYLKEKYELHIITNGFAEVQFKKLANYNIRHYFKEIITSERSGYKKPEQLIFEYSLKQVSARGHETLMIGDDLEVDVLGAQNAGMDQVYFNPQKTGHNESPTYEIACLSELINIF
jgi:putative hydrolase of the HAD superfamily